MIMYRVYIFLRKVCILIYRGKKGVFIRLFWMVSWVYLLIFYIVVIEGLLVKLLIIIIWFFRVIFK